MCLCVYGKVHVLYFIDVEGGLGEVGRWWGGGGVEWSGGIWGWSGVG